MNISVNRDLPRCPNITVDELHRHLAVDNLDDVHRGPSRWWHFRTDDTPRRLSARCEWFPMCRRHTRLVKPFVRAVCTCAYVPRQREKRGERVGRGGKHRETGRERKRNTRTRRRISGVPLLRSRYDARCGLLALISDTSVYRAVCLTRIDPVEWLPNIASMNTARYQCNYIKELRFKINYHNTERKILLLLTPTTTL